MGVSKKMGPQYGHQYRALDLRTPTTWTRHLWKQTYPEAPPAAAHALQAEPQNKEARAELKAVQDWPPSLMLTRAVGSSA